MTNYATAANKYEPVADFIDDIIANQSFYRQHANVINGALASFIGALLALASYAGGLEGDTPTWLPVLSTVIIPFVTAVWLKLTTNGVGPKQGEQLKAQAKANAERDARHINEALTAEALADMTDRFNRYSGQFNSYSKQFNRYNEA